MRAAFALLFRSFLWMLTGAALVVAAQLFGPTLVAGALPDRFKPDIYAEPSPMTPARIMEALKEIRGALE